MDENGQGDLTPEQREELAMWLDGFFQYLDHDPQAREEFSKHPGRVADKYQDKLKKERAAIKQRVLARLDFLLKQ